MELNWGSSWNTRGLGYYPEEPQKTTEMRWQESHVVYQKQRWGWNYSTAEGQYARRQLCRKTWVAKKLSSVTPQKRKPAVYARGSRQQVERTHSPLFSTCETTPQAQYSVSVPPASITRQTHTEGIPQAATKMAKKWWSAWHEKLVTRLVQPEKKKTHEDATADYNYLIARCWETQPDSLLSCPHRRTISNKATMQRTPTT